MTRSPREVIADNVYIAPHVRIPVRRAQFEDADRFLCCLSEEGWVVVPREPTDTMLQAGVLYGPDDSHLYADQVAEVYRAMLAAIDGEGK